jgi:serine phosphatase RsbU (regulator of sigma subunit)
MPLGWPYDQEWPETTLRMEKGDVVLAFSDGILELYDGTLAALDRVVAAVRAAASAEDLVAHFGRLAGSLTVLPDDVTVVAIRRTA